MFGLRVNKLGAGVKKGLTSDISFNEDFRNGADSLDALITYSGDSARWYFDSTGTLKIAPHNLGLDSEDIEAATWTSGTNITRGGTTSTPPSPYSNSKSAMETAVTGLHAQEGPAFTFVTGQAYTAAFVFSSIGGRNAEIGFPATVFTARFAKFTLSGDGAVYSVDVGVTASIQHLGNGFYLCKATSTCAAGASARVSYFVNDASYARSYAGDITKGLYVTGYALTLGSDQSLPYLATTSAARYLPRAHAFQDHNPSTLAPLGFLIEPASTNLILHSEDFTNGVYSPVGATVSANAINSPAATLTADKLEEDGTTGNHRIGQTYAGWTSGTTYTVSIFAKAAERTKFQLNLPVTAFTTEQLVTFDLVAKTATTASGTATGTIQELSNGWFRCTITAAATTTAAGGQRIYLFDASNSYTGTLGSGMYFWGLMLEAGAFPTSYIATTASAATRLADVASITGTAFSSFWNATEGTVVVRADINSLTSAIPTAWRVDNTTDDERIFVRNNGSGLLASIGIDGGATQFSLQTGNTLTAATQFRHALAYKLNDIATAFNGGNVLTNGAATLPTVTVMRIGGSNGGDYLGGHIQSLTIYRKRLTNAQIQTLTA